MGVTAWPFGISAPSLPRINFRWPRGVDARADVSRKAEIERAFRSVDTMAIQIDNRLNVLADAVTAIEARLTAAGIP